MASDNVAFFSRAEARAEQGRKVKALYDFPLVGRGATGRVIALLKVEKGKYVVRVKWDENPLRRTVSQVIVNLSFEKQAPLYVWDDFSKSDYHRLVEVLR